MADIQLIQTPEPTRTVRFVKVEEGFPNVYDLPIEKNFNDGTGVNFYVNMGFIPYDKFMSDQKEAEVKARQAAEADEGKKKVKA